MSQRLVGLIFIAWCQFATSEWFSESYYAEPIQVPPGNLVEIAYRDQNALHSKNQPATAYDTFILKNYPRFEENFDTNVDSSKNFEIKDDSSNVVKKRSISNSKIKQEGKNQSSDTIGLTRNKRWLFDQSTKSIYARPHTNFQNNLDHEIDDSPISHHNEFQNPKRGFSSWGGKRTGANVREFKPKRIRFSSWGGKRSDPSVVNWFKSNLQSAAHKTFNNVDIDNILSRDESYDKRSNNKFHSWGGKRNDIDLPIFDAYSVQPLFDRWSMDSPPLFAQDNWKKNEKKKHQFSAWGGKRSKLPNSEIIQLSDMEETPSSETNENGIIDN